MPYRCGKWYSLPLGDGSCAAIVIMSASHHTVDIAAFDDGESVPVARLRATDRALVLHRWQPLAHSATVCEAPPENDSWISAARAERVVASRLGRLAFAESRLGVRAMHNGAEPDGEMLTWGTPLDRTALTRIERYLAARPRTIVRLFGSAASDLRRMETSLVRRLRVASPIRSLELTNVRELHLEAPMDLDAALACAPNVAALRIASRGATIPTASIPASVRALDCTVAACPHLGTLANIEALRLAYLETSPKLSDLPPSLSALSLEHVPLRSLEALKDRTHLTQLELLGMWQFDLNDAHVLFDLPLKRASVDIGGRRKNVELYKRARWAYPWPFSYVMECAGAGNTHG